MVTMNISRKHFPNFLEKKNQEMTFHVNDLLDYSHVRSSLVLSSSKQESSTDMSSAGVFKEFTFTVVQ